MNQENVKEGEIKELEILEFKAGGNSYGVDINEIKEILPYQQKPTPIPNAHPYIEGMVMPRDFIIIKAGFGIAATLSGESQYPPCDAVL